MVAHDFRYAIRTLRRRPYFVVTAAMTLAIGIGANTALFSVIDAVLLRPLPYGEPQRLVSVFESNDGLGGSRHGPSPANVLDWRRESSTLSGIAAWWIDSTTLMGDGDLDTIEVPSAMVTEDFFPVLSVPPLLGRVFTAEEVQSGARVFVLSYGLWRSRFGGREDVVGLDVPFKNDTWTIVGVMPPDFRTPGTLRGEVQLVKPWDFLNDYAHLPEVPRDWRFLQAAARLQTGHALEVARAELEAIAAALAETYPKTNRGWGINLVPLRETLVGEIRTALLVLLIAVGFVLLVACANVASLLLVRASARSLEMAVRTAMGASRLRLVRQLLIESVLLGGAGGLIGVGLAHSLVPILLRLAPSGVPRLDESTMDLRVLGMALLLSLGAGLLAGLVPAFQGSTTFPSQTLKGVGGAVSSGRGRQRARTLIVVLEIAAAVVLLAVSGVFLKSFSQILAVDLGYNPGHLLVARMRLDQKRYGGGGAALYYTQLLQTLRALPGVESAGGTTGLPMDALDIDFDRPFWREGEPRPFGGGAGVQVRMATVGYFETMRIPLIEGRLIEPTDNLDKPRVLLVNQTMARQTWSDESPVGKRLFLDYQSYEMPYQVVGVVGDTRFYGPKRVPRPSVYIPHGQNPYRPLNLVIRARGDERLLAGAVRQAALELDPSQPVHSIGTMAELMGEHLGQDRFAAFLLTLLATVGLLLATVGVYGSVSESVSQRQREMGLRLALGAERSDIVKLVVGDGLRIAGAGAVLGLMGALAASRLIASELFGVSPTDPTALGLAAAVLMATVLCACYLPARRVAGIDPTDALRYQ